MQRPWKKVREIENRDFRGRPYIFLLDTISPLTHSTFLGAHTVEETGIPNLSCITYLQSMQQ